MRDREIVAAIVAGDPAGLAGAYDKYAESLYGSAAGCSPVRLPVAATEAVCVHVHPRNTTGMPSDLSLVKAAESEFENSALRVQARCELEFAWRISESW